MNLIYKPFKKFDKSITIIFIVLLLVGVLSIYSTTFSTKNSIVIDNNKIYTQIIFSVVALLIYTITSIFDYNWLRFKTSNLFLLSGTLLLLILVLFSPEIANVHRWIQIGGFQLQPSEFTKISLLITTSAIFSYYQEKIVKESHKFKHTLLDYIKPIGISSLIAFLYVILILLQPSGGIALLLSITFFLLIIFLSKNYLFSALIILGVFSANLTYLFGLNPIVWILILIGLLYINLKFLKKTSFIFITALAIGLIIVPTINLIWNSNLIKEYQRFRIEAFINPNLDPKSIGLKYQQERAVSQMLGVGIIGKGYLNGEKDINISTPDKHNDFAYSVMIEENGLIGAIIFHISIVFLVFKQLELYLKSKNKFGKNLLIGILLLIFNTYIFSTLINTDVLFNTGIPTPFISYGGSSLISIAILLGLTNSIKIHE